MPKPGTIVFVIQGAFADVLNKDFFKPHGLKLVQPGAVWDDATLSVVRKYEPNIIICSDTLGSIGDMINLLAKIFRRKKRKDQRFIVDDHELNIYDPNAPEEKEIVDLSLGGISFVYVDSGKRMDKVFELDLKIGDDYHLGKVRAKVASDAMVGEITTKSQMIRRLRARFINLGPLQEYELKRILNEYGK